jgi:hypothetical protein
LEATFGISGVDLGSCLGPSTIRLWRQGASALVAFCESDLLSFLPIYFPLFLKKIKKGRRRRRSREG